MRRPDSDRRSHLARGPGIDSQTLHQPLLIVQAAKLLQCQPEFLAGGKVTHPEQILFERADEPLGYPVAFRLPNEARGADHAQEGQLPLEIVTHVAVAVLQPDGQPRGDALIEAALVAD